MTAVLNRYSDHVIQGCCFRIVLLLVFFQALVHSLATGKYKVRILILEKETNFKHNPSVFGASYQPLLSLQLTAAAERKRLFI